MANVTVRAMTQGLIAGRATAAVRLTMTGPGEGAAESEWAAVANGASGGEDKRPTGLLFHVIHQFCDRCVFFALFLLTRFQIMSKGELTRQRIIAEAAPIFNQKGFEGTALSDLMRATGLEKGGIYRHFGNKQELAESAFDHAWRLAIDTHFDGMQEISNAVDRLEQIIRNFRDRRSGLVPGGCPLLNTAIDSDDGNPRLRARARQALKSWSDRLESIVEEGKRRGEVRADIDSAQLATLIISTLEGSLMISRLGRDGNPISLACDHLEEHLESKVRVRSRRRPRV